MKLFSLITIFIFPFLSWSGLRESGIPVSFVAFQAINFSLFIFLLVYFVRKRLLDFLKTQHENFTTDMAEAKDLESQQLKLCSQWEKDISLLRKKEADLTQEVGEALKNWEQAWRNNEKKSFQILQHEHERLFQQKKLKEWYYLKNQVWQTVMSQAQEQISLSHENKEKLNQQIINKLDRFILSKEGC